MHKPQEQVRAFHREVLKGPTSPAEPKMRNPHLRARLILEEAIETAIALVGTPDAQTIVHEQLLKVLREKAGGGEPDLVEAIDGCIDLIYVAYGTLEDIGVDGEPFMDEVHAANMRKVDAGAKQQASMSPLGKVLKPVGWTPPDIEGVLKKERFKYLVGEVKRVMDAGEIPCDPSREQRVSFAYGNVKLHNPTITREMVERAVDMIDLDSIDRLRVAEERDE